MNERNRIWFSRCKKNKQKIRRVVFGLFWQAKNSSLLLMKTTSKTKLDYGPSAGHENHFVFEVIVLLGQQNLFQ